MGMVKEKMNKIYEFINMLKWYNKMLIIGLAYLLGMWIGKFI